MSRPALVLFLFTFATGCSTLENYTENPFSDDTGENDEVTDICSNTGVGFPDDWNDAEIPLKVAWMVEHYGYQATAECLFIPPLNVFSTKDGEWPVDWFTLDIASYDNADWIDQFGESSLAVYAGDEKLDSYRSNGTVCNVFGMCGPHWEADLSEHNLSISPEDDIYLTFQLEAFEDPSEIDELWDETADQLAIMGYVGGFEGYSAGSLVTMFVEVVE